MSIIKGNVNLMKAFFLYLISVNLCFVMRISSELFVS